MRLNIADGEKFTAYLGSLKGATITEGERRSLGSIAVILERQFIGEYDVMNPNDERFFNLIGSLEKIINLYTELGLERSIAKLKKLLAVTRGKYLKEYLLVARNPSLGQYLTFDKGHIGFFGPAEWHTDINLEEYEQKWKEAIDIYHQTKENPRAEELSQALKQRLLEAIELAKNNIESKRSLYEGEGVIGSSYEEEQRNRSIGNYYKLNTPKFLETLAWAKGELA